MASRETLITRAQAMCDADGRTRYVKFTSLGWRIEFDAGDGTPPAIQITPQAEPAPPPALSRIWS